MIGKDKDLEQFTHDTLYEGRLVLLQPGRGYRFSIDSPVLTWFASNGGFASLTADLGAGCGVVGLGLLLSGQTKKVVGVEVQSSLARLAVRNAALNGLGSAYELAESDIRQPPPSLSPGTFDLVVSNPPFWPKESGRLPDDEERRIACHEILGEIDDWISTAANLLNPRRGRMSIVFPARRLDALLLSLDRSGFSCTRLLLVHPLASKPAELALVEARRGNPGRLVVEPPITLKQADGTDTPEAATIIKGEFSKQLRERPDRRPQAIQETDE